MMIIQILIQALNKNKKYYENKIISHIKDICTVKG